MHELWQWWYRCCSNKTCYNNHSYCMLVSGKHLPRQYAVWEMRHHPYQCCWQHCDWCLQVQSKELWTR
jgi:hypothetical protein